jgi:hypothetical protein
MATATEKGKTLGTRRKGVIFALDGTLIREAAFDLSDSRGVYRVAKDGPQLGGCDAHRLAGVFDRERDGALGLTVLLALTPTTSTIP